LTTTAHFIAVLTILFDVVSICSAAAVHVREQNARLANFCLPLPWLHAEDTSKPNLAGRQQ
jgi:hypothetical protein